MNSSQIDAHSVGTGRRRLRIVCPAYPRFNIYSRQAEVMTALGPICIATAVHDIPGWDAEVVDENNYRRGPTDATGQPDHVAIQQDRPANVVGFYGGLTSTIPRLYEIANCYKKLGVITIAGGHHFVEDNIAEALHSGVDIVVLGEGEKTITELLACFDTEGDLLGVRGIAFVRDGTLIRTEPRAPITDFNELPIPDFSALRYAHMKYYPISGVRGCGMNCEFCAVKGKPRFASPDRMMEQFASIYETWGGKIFFIVDDLFGQNRTDALRLCQMLHEYQNRMGTKFSITVQIRLDRARDTELLNAMRKAGIDNLAIGFESPIAEELEAMEKQLAPQDMIGLTKIYHRSGFLIHGMFIFGYPGPEGQPFLMGPKERVRRFRKFIRQAHLDTIQVLLPIPLPGTQLTHRLKQANRIYSTKEVGLEYYDGNFPLFEPDPPMTALDLQMSARRIMRRFYGTRHFVALLLHVITIPAITLWLHNIKTGWQLWYRRWWRILYRCSGWMLLRMWTIAFRKSEFLRKLSKAQNSHASQMISRSG